MVLIWIQIIVRFLWGIVHLNRHICIWIQLLHLSPLLLPWGRPPLDKSICKCRSLLFATQVIATSLANANFTSTRANLIEHERTRRMAYAAHVKSNARTRVCNTHRRSVAVCVNKIRCLLAIALIRRQLRPRYKAKVWLVSIDVCQLVDQCSSLRLRLNCVNW